MMIVEETDFTPEAPLLGKLLCPHQDGDFVLSVYDLATSSSGSCLIRQAGQGQIHDIVVTKSEAVDLAAILVRFGSA